MQQQVVILTKRQQIIQARLGEPLADYLRRRYLEDGLSLAELGAELGLEMSTMSRWLWQLGIEARNPGRKAS